MLCNHFLSHAETKVRYGERASEKKGNTHICLDSSKSMQESIYSSSVPGKTEEWQSTKRLYLVCAH